MPKRYSRTLPPIEAMQCLESNVDEVIACCDGERISDGVLFCAYKELLPSNLVRFGDWLVLHESMGERRFSRVSDAIFRSQYKEID